MLSGRAALEHPEINDLKVVPVAVPTAGGVAAGTPGATARSRARSLSEFERRALGLRRSGSFRRRRSG